MTDSAVFTVAVCGYVGLAMTISALWLIPAFVCGFGLACAVIADCRNAR